MTSIRIRTSIKAARSAPPVVMVMPQKSTSTLPSLLKNRFSTPVKTRIITSGFMPRTMDFPGMAEILITVSRNRSSTP